MAPEGLRLRVDGQPAAAATGEALLAVLRRLGCRVPTLCHHEQLTPSGFCGLCLVRDRQSGELVRACSTVVRHGMVVDTSGSEVIAARRRRLAALVASHPLDCPDCPRSGDCRLQDLLFEIGLEGDPARPALPPVAAVAATPVISLDRGRCLGCGRCMRLCSEVQGVFAGRGGRPDRAADIAVFHRFEHECEHCGLCVESCPVAALVAPSRRQVPAWRCRTTLTTCSLCSCGCELEVQASAGEVQRASSAAAPPRRAAPCVKGWLGWDILSSPERLTTPLLRRDGQLEEASWEEALAAATAALARARAAGTPIATIGSTRLATEDAYLLQRLLRAGLGSPHLSCAADGGVAALVEGVGALCAAPVSTAGFNDLSRADLILIVRGDPGRTHPAVKSEAVHAVTRGGRRLILAHALSGALQHHASRFLQLRPGSDEVLLWGVAATIAGGSIAADLEVLPGSDDWRCSLEKFPVEVVAATTGLEPAEIEALAAELVAARCPVIVVVTGVGIPGDEAGVARAAVSLHALLAAGGGVLVLGEKANAQGVVDVGLHPDLLPGHAAAADAAARRALQKRWRSMAFAGPGWRLDQLSAHAGNGECGVLYLVGHDPLASWPRSLDARAAVAGAGCVVVHDAFLTATARRADVVLPVAILGERSGTVVAADGVRRPLRQVVPPPAGLPQDGQLLLEIARRLGVALPSGAELDGEIEELTGARRHAAGLVRLVAAEPPLPCAAAGTLLDASPQLCHCGAVTLHSSRLVGLAPPVVARLNPADAGDLDLTTGEVAAIAAGGRELLFRVRLDRSVRPGTVVVPWHGSPDGASALAIAHHAATAAVIRRPP